MTLPTGMEIHLDASDATTLFTDSGKATPVSSDGDLVYTWEDKSGNGNDFQQSVSAERPAYKQALVNSLDVLNFDGGDDNILSGAISNLNTDLQTWFFVLRPDDRTTTTEYFWGQAYTSGFGGAESTAINAFTANHAWAHWVRPYTDDYVGHRVVAPTVVSWRWNSDNTVEYWINGAGSFATLTGKTATPAGHVRVALGERSDATGTGNFDGHFCEVVGYASALSDADRIQAEQHLCTKWGLDHIVVDTSASLYSGTSPDDWLGRPTIIKTGAGAWAAIYREASSHAYESTDNLHIRFSTDEGATWGGENIFTDAGSVTGFPIDGVSTYGVQNPGAVTAPNNDLLLFSGEITATEAKGIQQYTSTDDGEIWTSDGRINADTTLVEWSDTCIIGSDIYIVTYIDAGSDLTAPYKTTLYKSTDNGGTWAAVTDVTTTTDDTNEAGVAHLGGNNIMVVIRANDNVTTYMRISDDLGATWGTLTDITANVGVVHKPRLYTSENVSGRTYMTGRAYGNPRDDYMALWYTDDDGTTWNGPYILGTEAVDTAYTTMVQRASTGELYIWSYLGTTGDADIWEVEATMMEEAAAVAAASAAYQRRFIISTPSIG